MKRKKKAVNVSDIYVTLHF